MSQMVFGSASKATSQGLADTRRMAVASGRLDEAPTGSPVACQSQGLSEGPPHRRALGRGQAEEGHELARAIEAPQVSDLGGKGYSAQEGYAAYGLIGRDYGCHRPLGGQAGQLLLEPALPLDGAMIASWKTICCAA